MEMHKIIKKFGNSKMVLFSTEDLKILEKEVGDVLSFRFVSGEEEDKVDDDHQIRKANWSYEEYLKDIKNAVARGFNDRRFVLTEAEHKKYYSYFNKKTGWILEKEKDNFIKWFDKIAGMKDRKIWGGEGLI